MITIQFGRPLHSVFKVLFLGIIGFGLTCPGPVFADNNMAVNEYATATTAITSAFPNYTHTELRQLKINASLRSKFENQLASRWPVDSVQWHAIFQKKKWVGNAIVLDEIGKHKPITFCVILTPDDEVKSVTVLTYREPVGSDIRKHRFMKQFANRRISDIPTIDDDIAPITGATLSSWAAVTAVKKALIVSPLIHP